MFPTGNKPPLKRSRLSGTTEDVTPEPSSQPSGSRGQVVLGKTALNSIPFSLTAFVDSLDEEQRALLQLECQTMQKAWSVASSPVPENCSRSAPQAQAPHL